jgi:hypothetical protein
MNNETIGNRGPAEQNDAQVESAAAEQSTSELAELSAPDMGLAREKPRPLSNPTIRVES